MADLMLDTESLELGSTRRRGTDLAAAAAVGLLVGAAVTAWWGEGEAQDSPRQPAAAPASSFGDVRLVLTGVRPSPSSAGALTIDAVLLHGRREGTATVTDIQRPSQAISIRTRELPVTLSVNRSFERIQLQVTPQDCALATEWTPSSQPLVVTWEDDRGDVHETLGGDHDAALEISLTSRLDAACATG